MTMSSDRSEIKIPILNIEEVYKIYQSEKTETAALRDFMRSLDRGDLSFYVNCHTAVHLIAGTFNVYYKPEYTITKHEISVLNY